MKDLIQNDWKNFIEEELSQPYFLEIEEKLNIEQNFYPEKKNIFKAFENCSFKNTKVVILGQDPYHGENQAMGLSFSVPKNQKIPPSLKNIYKELTQNFDNFVIPNHGDLSSWSKQGILLLNAGLTVRAGEPNSHKNFGWENFSNAVIKKISAEKQNVVFLLWGKFAQSKKNLIDQKKHKILTAPHPSPFSAYKGFFGCQHFTKTNEYLAQTRQNKIDWTILP